MVEAGTFLAILLGTILGSAIAGHGDYILKVSIAILTFALLGRFVAQYIPQAPAVQADLKIDYHLIRSTGGLFKGLTSTPNNLIVAVGISWFWFFGAIFLTQFPAFAKDILKGTPYVATLLMGASLTSTFPQA